MGDPLLAIRDLHVTYATGDGALPAVRGVDLTVERGQIVGVAGESGCGKSTLASTVLRLQPANATVRGEVLLDGRDVLTMKWGELRAVRWAGASIVFQGALHSLNPVHRVGASDRRAAPPPHSGLSDEAIARRVARAVRAGRSRPRARPQLPAPAVRRSEAADHDRDGPGLRPRAGRGRRADHRPRRDGAGAGARRVVRPRARARGRDDDDQPRPVGARRRLRPDHRDVRRSRGRGRRRRAGLLEPLHPYSGALSAAFPRIGDPPRGSHPRAFPAIHPTLATSRVGAPSRRGARAPPMSVCPPSPSSRRTPRGELLRIGVRIGEPDEAAS